jgi:hypothetical protein
MGDDARYLEKEVAAMSASRLSNIERICRLAVRHVGNAMSRPGSVPPRVAGCLLADGSFVRDPLVAVYWAGVLAGSRTDSPDDDRGVRRLKLLARLATRHIHAHYLFYGTLRRLLADRNPSDVDFDGKRYRMAVFVPARALVLDLAFLPDEQPRLGQLLFDILNGLGGELLLDGSNTGSEEYLKRFFKTEVIRGEGVVYAPSLAGVHFFLWAFAAGDAGNAYFLSPDLRCAVEGVPGHLEGAAMVYDGA